MTIVSLRGTHGSGKSTVVRKIMDRYRAQPFHRDDKGRPSSYQMYLPDGNFLFTIGRYETACGGCDAVQPYARIWPMVEYCARQGSVLFEGALVSSSYGNIGRSSEVFGDDMVFAFLDTPLEVCLERIAQRRLAKGNSTPVNPDNTTFKYNSVEKSISKIRDEFGRRVVIIDHQKPVVQVLKLFGVSLRKEPT